MAYQPNVSLRRSAVQPAPFQPAGQAQRPAMRAPRQIATPDGGAARPSTADLMTHQITGAGGLPVQTGLPPAATPLSIANRGIVRPAVPGTVHPLEVHHYDPGTPPGFPPPINVIDNNGGGAPNTHHGGGGGGGLPPTTPPATPPVGTQPTYPGGTNGHHGGTPLPPPPGTPVPDGPAIPLPPQDPGGHLGPGTEGGNTPPPQAPSTPPPTLPDAPTIETPQSTLYNAATLGQQYLSDYDKANAEAEQNAYRQAGQYNAALGRLGSGMTRDDINRVTRNIDADRLAFAYNAGNSERQYLTGRQDADRGYGLQRASVNDELANSDAMRRLQLAQFTRNGPNDPAAVRAYLQSGQNAAAAQTATGPLLNSFALGQVPGATPYTPIPAVQTPPPAAGLRPGDGRYGVYY